MSDPFSIEIKNTDQVRSELLAVASQIVSTSDDAARQVADDVASAAQAAAPVDQGELRDSIGVVGEGGEYTVQATAEHAPFVEYGTSRMVAQPFLGPAAEANSDSLSQKVADAISKAVG